MIEGKLDIRTSYDPARLQATQELHALLIDYWHDVDTNWGRNAPDYYTEDALFETPGNSYRSREKIREFYEWRVGRGPRVAVHSVTNFRIETLSDAEATCTWYMLLYAQDGVPVLPTNPPIQIALLVDRYVKDLKHGWLCAHRRFEPWFSGGVPTTNPVLDNADGTRSTS